MNDSTYQRAGKVLRYRRVHLRVLEAARLRRRVRKYGPGPNAPARVKASWRRFAYSAEPTPALEMAA